MRKRITGAASQSSVQRCSAAGWESPGPVIDGCRSLYVPRVFQLVKFVATTARDTPKATLASNVSCNSIYAPSIHGQMHLLDSMHACLNVDEIVRLIARKLVASGGGRAAVSLACCCRSFEDPVLDALWTTQDGLLPLFKTFPGDVWKENGYGVSAQTTCIFFFS